MVGGLLINGIIITIKYFIVIPDALACFVMGIGFSLLCFGIYAMSHDVRKLKTWKRNLLKNFKI